MNKKGMAAGDEEKEPRAFETDEEKGARLSKKSPLRFLVDANLTIEGLRVSTQIRKTHLGLRGETDPETDALLTRLESVEKDMDAQVKRLIEAHPAYPFFSRVKGVGAENISKVVSFIDIEKADTPSALWKFAGYHVDQETGKAPRPKPGEKLEFNKKLRTMCWRLANSIVKSGAIHGGSKFYDLFERELKRLNEKYKATGVKIVPSDDLPIQNGKRYEPTGMISVGHVRNQALRKMTKVFLCCLWVAWREALGLPTQSPFVIGKWGHTHVVSPWDMLDRPEKRKRAKPKAA